MSDRGYLPIKPVTYVTQDGDDAEIEAVRQTAEQGVFLAQNARAMAKRIIDSDVPRLDSLEALAADYQSRVAESLADRASLHQRLDEIELIPGPQGPAGADGKDGLPGRDGSDGAPGIDGKPGKDGVNGNPGKDGINGAPGKDGAVGPAGKDGINGKDGAPGATGPQGIPGPQGAQGIQGVTGATGPAGPQGPAGTGTLTQVEFRDGIAIPAMLSLLNLQATADVTVTWVTPFPDTNYTIVKPQTTPTTASLIGKTDAVVKSKTATGCTVTVTTTAVLAAGSATLSVLAYRKS